MSVAYITQENIETNSDNLINYRVSPSDNLAGIADKFNLHIGDIKKWNGTLQHENHVQTGQILRIPITAPADSRNFGP